MEGENEILIRSHILYYEEVFSQLNARGVRYLVIGGIAVNLHGIPRMTADLDLMVDLSPANITKLIEALTLLGYSTKAPVDPNDLTDPEIRKKWQEEKHMAVFSFYKTLIPYYQIDILLENPIDFDTAYRDRDIMGTEYLPIPVISLRDLIQVKKLIGRKQDKADIESLKKVKKIKREKGNNA
ncbi:MAG: hypothetical protein A3G93_02845 [Nitrospinae bacterium RIFCSPLOWO2_12_FULL_45_22]|nr:MAG: hypothetical protein A3G93_02845 [Nitrospinae bacterium RIFCSPLOWO2_12_FULL_45_22]